MFSRKSIEITAGTSRSRRVASGRITELPTFVSEAFLLQDVMSKSARSVAMSVLFRILVFTQRAMLVMKMMFYVLIQA